MLIIIWWQEQKARLHVKAYVADLSCYTDKGENCIIRITIPT